MTEVRRSQHELRQKAGQRGRFEADGAALAIDGGTPDPTAPARQIEDRVAGLGVGVDPRGDEAGRRRWGEAVEERQAESGSPRTRDARPAMRDSLRGRSNSASILAEPRSRALRRRPAGAALPAIPIPGFRGMFTRWALRGPGGGCRAIQ